MAEHWPLVAADVKGNYSENRSKSSYALAHDGLLLQTK